MGGGRAHEAHCLAGGVGIRRRVAATYRVGGLLYRAGGVVSCQGAGVCHDMGQGVS